LHTFFFCSQKESVGRYWYQVISRKVYGFRGVCFTQISELPKFKSQNPVENLMLLRLFPIIDYKPQ
jgi:hypothetical protein